MSPIESVREYLEMAHETRRAMRPSDITVHDEWVTTFRHTLEDQYHLDLTDTSRVYTTADMIAAVAAGVVEGVGAAIEHDSPSTALMSVGWALYDLALPHLAAQGTLAS